MKEPKFTCMTFTGGKDDCFVASKRAYPTTEAAIEACIIQTDHLFIREKNPLRRPTAEDVNPAYCKYYIQPPSWCGKGEFDSGIYTFAPEGDRGAFPVWVIDFGKLKQAVKPGGEENI